MTRKALFPALLVAFLVAPAGFLAGSPEACADEAADARLERLEKLILEQARQLEALRKDLEASRGSVSVEASPPAPPVPASPRVSPPAAAPAHAQPAPPIHAPSHPTQPAPPVMEAGTPDPTGIPAPEEKTLAEKAQLTRTRNLQRTIGGPTSGVRWGGYVTLEYIANSEKNSFFDLHRLVLQLDASLTDCFDLSGEIEYEHGGIGGGRTGDVEVEFLQATWRLSDGFNFKTGAPLVPFGRFNLFHDDPLNDFTQRPLVARYLIPTGFGQPGIGAEGVFRVGCQSVVSYDVLVTNGYADGFTADSGVRDARQKWNTDNNEDKQAWARVAYAMRNRHFDRIEGGVSGTWGKFDDAGENALTGFALDGLIRRGPFELMGEYMAYDFERSSTDPVTAVRGQNGYYVQLAYHFMPCALQRCLGCAVQDVSHFTIAARYQGLDLDTDRTGASRWDDTQAFGLGLNYRLTERTVFRIDQTWFDHESVDDTHEFTFSFSTYF